MRQIVLLTDFGLQNHYVGVMKGVPDIAKKKGCLKATLEHLV